MLVSLVLSVSSFLLVLVLVLSAAVLEIGAARNSMLVKSKEVTEEGRARARARVGARAGARARARARVGVQRKIGEG